MSRATVSERSISAEIPGALLLIYGLSALAYLTIASWSSPILDMFGFRQAQTAISAYWIAKGGPLFAYQTPVFGYPWSIPFEFPLYQWLVALLADSSGLSLDQSGRLISIAFFIAAAAALYKLVLRISCDRALSLACAGVFVASPMAVFWARSVMIESTAVFLSLAFLCAIAEFHCSPKVRYALATVFFGICAGLVKVTTFYGFAVLLALVLVFLLVRDLKTPRFRQTLRSSLLAGVAVVLSLVALLLWVAYSDNLKLQTPLGDVLTAAKTAPFEYGTLQQRLDMTSWREIIFGRSVLEILGSGWILLAAACVLVFNAAFRAVGFLLLVCYLIPFLTFTNLHYVHSYYQFANFVFLTSAVGLAIALLAKQGPKGVVAASLFSVAVAATSWHALTVHFVPTIIQDQSRGRTISLARFVRAHTGQNQTLLIFGLDWSPEVPYYATRKALLVPDWAPREKLNSLLDQEKAFGKQELGALIVCPNGVSMGGDPAYQAIIKKYSYSRENQMVSDCQVYF